jgi:hypothetical protein
MMLIGFIEAFLVMRNREFVPHCMEEEDSRSVKPVAFS